MNYLSLCADSDLTEVSYDPQGRMGLVIAAQAPAQGPDPLEALCDLEDFLIEQHGMTFLQAVRAGVLSKGH